MRYLATTNMGWIVVPVLAIVGAAYVWIVSKLLPYEQPKPEQRRSAAPPDLSATVRARHAPLNGGR
jgi:hypothetical protein